MVVKWLRAEVRDGSPVAARFAREAAFMAGEQHEGVVEVYRHDHEENGTMWMAMEFVDGRSPAAVIRPGDVAGVYRFMAGVARSLDELHGRGIVHRDLKPDNILLRGTDTGWETVIIDLGIAKWLGHVAATTTGAVFGTPYYMSPEQFRDSKHVGPATDRYALAVIAYELLTGERPFNGRTVSELLLQHLEFNIPPLRLPTASQRRPGGTEPAAKQAPALDAFMRKALAKAPGERYSSAMDMAAAFREAAEADTFALDRSSELLFDPIRRPIVEIEPPEGDKVRFDVREGPIVLGRHEACQVVFVSPRMSRLHACIYPHHGRIWVADLASQNGSQYVGRPLLPNEPAWVRDDGEVSTLRLYDMDVAVRLMTDDQG